MKTTLPTSKSTIGDFLGFAGDFYSQQWKKIMSIIAVVFVPIGIIQAALMVDMARIVQQPEYADMIKNISAKTSKEVDFEAIMALITPLTFSLVGMTIIVIIGGLLHLWTSLALITFVKKSFAQEEITWRQAYKESAHLWPTSLGTSIILGLLTFLLYLLLIIPGIIFSVYWMFAVIAIVWSGKGMLDSLSYSKQLVMGNWWRMLGYTLVLSIIASIILQLLLSLVSFISSLLQLQILDVFSNILLTQAIAAFILIFNCYVYAHLEMRLTESEQEKVEIAA